MNTEDVTYFEHIPKGIRKYILYLENILANIYSIQAYNSILRA